jgi:hypothetical protein
MYAAAAIHAVGRTGHAMSMCTFVLRHNNIMCLQAGHSHSPVYVHVLCVVDVTVATGVGLALSFHVAFGALVKNYSSPGLSFNSVMRMAVGDFDFDEIYSAGPLMALSLFWLSSLLIVFVLINIFIAIIMQAYDTVLSMNPDAADASNFGSMVMMQLTRILSSFLGLQVESGADESAANVHVLQNSMDRIEDEAYCEITTVACVCVRVSSTRCPCILHLHAAADDHRACPLHRGHFRGLLRHA